MSNTKIIHKNNFDFLRLLFASFVVITHAYFFLGKGTNEPLFQYTGVLLSSLGVHGFFVISGYLIQQSLQRSKSLQLYFRKRLKRILPALLVVIFFSAFIIGPIFSKLHFSDYFLASGTWVYWLANSFLIPIHPTLPGVFSGHQLTSAVNGSLWTLRFEFLFYALLALLYFVSIKNQKMKYLIIGGILFISYYLHNFVFPASNQGLNHFLDNFLNLSMYFLIGSIISVYKNWLLRYKFYIFIFSFIFLLISLFFIEEKSILILFSFPLVVLSFGNFYFPILDYSKFTGDISYGTYIYAFPIQQALISLFIFKNVVGLILPSLLLSFLFGYLSWNFIEKRFVIKKIKHF